MALNDKQQRFVEEYMVDLNATQAAIRAGYSLTTASEMGYENLRKPQIAVEIDKLMKERSERLNITADMVLQQWWDIATADPSQIIHNRAVCCRYCFGINHEYQWMDEQEFNKAIMAEQKRAKLEERPVDPIDNYGGYGYNPTIRPHPLCPRCHGEGYSQVVMNDTRDLPHKEKLLYNGVEQSRQGIKVKLRDQDKALENVARHLGMFKDNVTLTGAEGGALNVIFSPKMSGNDG